MRWSKIKNIIILLLALVNVCLLAMVGQRAWRSQRSDRELREQMLTVLEKNGIEFLPDQIPGRMPLSAQTLASELPSADQAAKFLGGGAAVSAAESGALTYTAAAGTVTFSPDARVEGAFSAPGALGLTAQDPAQAGLELLERLGGSFRAGAWDPDAGTCAYVQLWEGAPVPQARIVITFSDDGRPAALSGTLLSGTAQAVAQGELLSASTALARFLDGLQRQAYVCSQITQICPGYAVSGAGPLSLSPMWYLETDASWSCGVDAVTGAVTIYEPAS